MLAEHIQTDSAVKPCLGSHVTFLGCDRNSPNVFPLHNVKDKHDLFKVMKLTYFLPKTAFGGARRDRTDDLKLAKLALSQLSYGPSKKPNGGPGTT